MKIFNATRDVALADHADLARSPWARFRGLMGRRALVEGSGLVLEPCNSIHMFFMRFSIDAVFLDRDWKVVYIAHRIKPWRITRLVRKAKRVIEMPAGTCQTSGTVVGDVLTMAR